MIPYYSQTGVAVVAVLAQMSSAIISNIIFSKEIFKFKLKSLFFIRQNKVIKIIIK